MPIKFIKVGRIYWIKPKPHSNFQSKIRPAIVLAKYDNGKTIFIHLGSSKPKEKCSLAATHIIRKCLKNDTFRPNRETEQTYVWIDPSKPEWNTSIIKPHMKDNSYIDINLKKMKKIRQIYFKRKRELEVIRINKAKGYYYLNEIKKAKNQLNMLIDKDPIKHKNLNIDNFFKKLK